MHILSGKYRHRTLVTPKGAQTRPTTSRLRETVFNILQNQIEGAEVLDIFAGSGAIGIEALSRGACSATFIENHPLAIRCIKANLRSLDIDEKNRIYTGDFKRALSKLLLQEKHFDIAFADPPYGLEENGMRVGQYLTHWFQEHSLLKTGGFLLIEDSSKIPPDSFQTLSWLNSRRSGMAYLHLYQYLAHL